MNRFSGPVSLCLGITNKCNLNCVHCRVSDMRNEPDFSKKELADIIRQIIDLRVLNVSISGGEPLMRKDFFAIIDKLNSKSNIAISLNTNGTLVTKDIAKRLAASGLWLYKVSLDGASPKVNDAIRGNGAFVRAYRGIENLVAKGCSVVIATAITRLNYQDAEKIVLLGKKLGVRCIRFNEVTYTGNAAHYHELIAMKPKERFKFLSKAMELKRRFPDFLIGTILRTAEIMKNIQHHGEVKFPLTTKLCMAATIRCTIRPDGWVVPCDRLWFLKAGNIKKASLYKIWHDSPVMKAFRKTIEIKKRDIPECAECKYVLFCYQSRPCNLYFLGGGKYGHKELYCWNEKFTEKQ